MKIERTAPAILNCRRLPARLTREQTADLLNFHDADSVSALVAKRLLRPLGDRRGREAIWFATCEIVKLGEDVQWLSKATKIVRDGIAIKNSRKRNAIGNTPATDVAPPHL